MAASLKVDLDALCALEQRCRSLATAFDDGAHDRLVGLIDQIGAPRVREALDDFEDHGADGRKKVTRHLDGLVERLAGAVEQYEHTEGDLNRQIQESVR